MDSKVFTIDIDEIVRGKAGAKARFVPRFVLSWLKRIIHQDEVNEFILGEGDKRGMPWLDDCMEYLGTKLNVKGLENLPDDSDGRLFTFVSNHPLGGPDGVALGHLLGHRYDGRIKYLVNDLLMNLHGLAPFFVPINKTGKQSRNFPQLVEAVFNSPNHIIMFPAGLCSRKIQGKIQDLDWKKSFIQKAITYQRDIIPIYFDGRNSHFFYNFARIRKALGIRMNYEMIYLPDEMFKSKHSTFRIYFGEPIPWQTFDKKHTTTEWANWVREIAYNLK